MQRAAHRGGLQLCAGCDVTGRFLGAGYPPRSRATPATSRRGRTLGAGVYGPALDLTSVQMFYMLGHRTLVMRALASTGPGLPGLVSQILRRRLEKPNGGGQGAAVLGTSGRGEHRRNGARRDSSEVSCREVGRDGGQGRCGRVDRFRRRAHVHGLLESLPGATARGEGAFEGGLLR